jgi:predicted metalloprotease with PDZ domain
MPNKSRNLAARPVAIVALYLLASLSVVTQTQELTGEYRIKISDDNPLLAFVEAQIPVKDGRLFMAPWGADFLPAGWATFVRNLRVSDESNRQLAVESKPNGEWQISNGFIGRVTLSYQVDLSFTKTKWPPGNEQAGILQGNALFVVSKALFIVADTTGKRRLTFDLPGSWKISAPWQSSDSKARVFVAQDNNDLIDNSIVMGRYVGYSFNQGNFTLMLTLLGPMERSKELVANALQKVVQKYGRIFKRTPRSNYLMTVFYADEADAEAYSNSAAFTEHDPLRMTNLIQWGNTLAHEFFHSWNGHAIAPEDYAASQWFTEGFTEYFANLALVQQHLISDDLFIRKMENNLGLYIYFKTGPAFDGITLKQAGSKKGLHRLGVYDGGWAVAFCLDVLIRDETGSRKSLEDVMRLMYERFGLTAKKYGYEDIVTATSETVGHDVSDFFAKYVAGDKMLPIKEYLERAGFDGYTQFYDGEIYIFASPNASRKKITVRQGILRGR